MQWFVSRFFFKTRRTPRFYVLSLNEPLPTEFAGAETVVMVEPNMCNALMRGTVHPVGVEEHITRKRIASEPGISHVWPSVESSLSRTAVRIGKARSRSR